LALALVLSVPLLPVRAAAATPEFDVVSIRPASGETGVHVLRGKSLALRGITLVALVRMAYDLYGFQVAGGPNWAAIQKFDVNAKVENPVPPETFDEMLQSMLATRFQLRTHREQKQMPAYVLTIAKKGLKMQASAAADEPAPGDFPVRMVGMRRLRGRHATIAQLVTVLTRNVVHAPVVDQTNLPGLYDFTLEWGPDDTVDGNGSATQDSRWPPLPMAIEQQLGLAVSRQKSPIPVLVIDAAQPPSPN
jgi:uncharacterized protein (TIGR03435 family)